MTHAPSIYLNLYRNFNLSTTHLQATSLSHSENTRLSAIQSQRRRREYIVGHQLIRTTLNQCLPNWSANNAIVHPTNGAPYLLGPQQNAVSISLSHSDDNFLCAVGIDCQVGVDIEQEQRIRPYQEIADTYFSKQEALFLAAMANEQLSLEFYRLWTLKESLIKAKKAGLSRAGMITRFQPTPANERVETDGSRKPSNTPWHSYYSNINSPKADGNKRGALHISVCSSVPLENPLSLSLHEQNSPNRPSKLSDEQAVDAATPISIMAQHYRAESN